jgi:ABC-type multidrug transport system ATPase subunit
MQTKIIKDTLDLQEYENFRAGSLSGGNKRKLVCAMSLVACPKVNFLDEPTTGVDPVSRRSLFKMLKNLQGSSLIMTTHRMDEAEALCDKVAIMINGRFACYGTPTHLKELYGKGYQISVKCTFEEPPRIPFLTEVKRRTVDNNGLHIFEYQVNIDDQFPLNNLFD